jgi:hypothetical protein
MAPGLAEQIAHRRIGGVAQTRILHRPACERERERKCDAEQRHTAKLAQAAAQRCAEFVGQETKGAEAAVDGAHGGHPSTATRRVSASSVVLASCTTATRI